MNGQILLSMVVEGRPRTKGSMKPLANIGTGKVRMVEQVNNASWRKLVTNEAIRQTSTLVGQSWRKRPGFPFDDAVAVEMIFTMDAGDSASAYPTDRQHGDVDKLTRLVLDALTDAKVYTDDSLVVHVAASKIFGSIPCATVVVRAA